jgi:hypothetical protein
MSYVDFLGVEIEMGDTVVYPTRRRGDMSLKKAVVSAKPGGDSFSLLQGIQCVNEKGRRVAIKHPERCVVVKKARVPCESL